MSSKRRLEPPQRSAPILTAPLEQVRQEIANQIEKGRQLKARKITAPDQLSEAKADEQRWSAYNKTLLLQFFTNDTLWKDYDFTYLGRLPLGMYGKPPLNEQVQALVDRLDRRINMLVSVEERLPLMLPRGSVPVSDDRAQRGAGVAPVIVNVTDSPQAHVNIHGADTSTSSLNAQRQTVFTQLHDVVSEKVGDIGERTRLLAKIGELEAVKDKPAFLTRYKEFMALAANHMTALGPFLPALAQWLGVSS